MWRLSLWRHLPQESSQCGFSHGIPVVFNLNCCLCLPQSASVSMSPRNTLFLVHDSGAHWHRVVVEHSQHVFGVACYPITFHSLCSSRNLSSGWRRQRKSRLMATKTDAVAWHEKRHSLPFWAEWAGQDHCQCMVCRCGAWHPSDWQSHHELSCVFPTLPLPSLLYLPSGTLCWTVAAQCKNHKGKAGGGDISNPSGAWTRYMTSYLLGGPVTNTKGGNKCKCIQHPYKSNQRGCGRIQLSYLESLLLLELRQLLLKRHRQGW